MQTCYKGFIVSDTIKQRRKQTTVFLSTLFLNVNGLGSGSVETIQLITDRIRSMVEGYVFTGICHSVIDWGCQGVWYRRSVCVGGVTYLEGGGGAYLDRGWPTWTGG